MTDPLEQPWSYLGINGWTVALEQHEGRLVWVVTRSAYDKTPTGRRRYNTHRIETVFTSPWMHQAIAYAVAYTQGVESRSGNDEQLAIYRHLAGEQ